MLTLQVRRISCLPQSFARVCNPPLALTIGPEIDSRRAEQYPGRSMSLDQIRKSLPTKPVCLTLVFFLFFPALMVWTVTA